MEVGHCGLHGHLVTRYVVMDTNIAIDPAQTQNQQTEEKNAEGRLLKQDIVKFLSAVSLKRLISYQLIE